MSTPIVIIKHHCHFWHPLVMTLALWQKHTAPLLPGKPASTTSTQYTMIRAIYPCCTNSNSSLSQLWPKGDVLVQLHARGSSLRSICSPCQNSNLETRSRGGYICFQRWGRSASWLCKPFSTALDLLALVLVLYVHAPTNRAARLSGATYCACAIL